ncbi:MAG: hypothetical protein GMKNLPBB_00618 [Myxococcota bacterium]|nr:hypothetical protein [Myxococcota bacterium]
MIHLSPLRVSILALSVIVAAAAFAQTPANEGDAPRVQTLKRVNPQLLKAPLQAKPEPGAVINPALKFLPANPPPAAPGGDPGGSGNAHPSAAQAAPAASPPPAAKKSSITKKGADAQEGPSDGPPPVPEAPKGGKAGDGDKGGVDPKDALRGNPKNKIVLKLDKAELTEVIATVAEYNKVHFIIPDSLKRAKVTVYSHKDAAITPDQLWNAFLSILEVNKLGLVKSGNFYKIVDKRAQKNYPIPLYIGKDRNFLDREEVVTWIYTCEFIDGNTILPTVKQLITPEGDVMLYTPTNTLIFTDSEDVLARIQRILEELDIAGGDETINIVNIRYASAQDIATKLENIYNLKQQQPGQPRRPQPGTAGDPASGESPTAVSVSRIIPDERTNKLIIIADRKSMKNLERLINQLDIPLEGDGQVHVYYLKNTDAAEIAQTLAALTQGIVGRTSRAAQQAPAGSAPQRGASNLFEGEVKVTADPSTNSLVVIASGSDFKSLVKVIEQLDIPRKEVFVEAVIMEVGIDRQRDTGVAFNAGAAPTVDGKPAPMLFGTNFGNLNSITLSPGTLGSLVGFLGGVRGPDVPGANIGGIAIPSFGAILQLLAQNSDVNVLSTPHIITTDNQEAEIVVGENVPFQAGFTNNLGGVGGLGGFNPIVSIQRQDVALKLKLKPQISDLNKVRLVIEIEVSEIARENQLLGPTTSKRSAKSIVTADDQQTVIIGGLIRDRSVESATKVPFFGDIPIIGFLFRSKKVQKTKTNLLLMLTPYIIREQADFAKILERKLKERDEFLERYHGIERDAYDPYYDFDRAAGALSTVRASHRREMARAENGGQGVEGETIIRPGTETPSGGSAPAVSPDPPAAPKPPAAEDDGGPVKIFKPRRKPPRPEAAREPEKPAAAKSSGAGGAPATGAGSITP